MSQHQWFLGSYFWNLLPPKTEDRIGSAPLVRVGMSWKPESWPLLPTPGVPPPRCLGSTPGRHWKQSENRCPAAHYCQTASASPISSCNYVVLRTESLTSTWETSNFGHRVNHRNDSTVRRNMSTELKERRGLIAPHTICHPHCRLECFGAIDCWNIVTFHDANIELPHQNWD